MENKENNIKEMVKSKYNLIANQSKSYNETSCCGSGGCCETIDYTIMSDDYSNLTGYNEKADLGLGCGLPTQYAKISTGDTVLDLGSGAGNDCFVARSIVGESGKVIGLDFAPNMLEKARKNTENLGYKNVHFISGDIEDMPLEDNMADVVISNCVLNLVPDKEKAFSQVFRVLRPGGHFSVSDVVLQGELPDELVKDAEMYAGCVAGAIQKDKYLQIIEKSGFKNIEVLKEKEIILPNEILKNYLTEEVLKDFKVSNLGIFSVTVYGEKK